MSKLFSLGKVLLCLCFLFISIDSVEAQRKRSSKKSSAEPFMHIAFESPLWLSSPNTLDNSHNAGFGFRADFPINGGPWNFVTGFSNYNFGNHLNILDISDSQSIEGNEGTITVKEGTYLLKYAALPLGFKYDKKFWSTSFGFQFMFNLNQAEMHGEEIKFIFGTDDFQDFSKEKLNKLNPSFVYSIGANLPIGDRWKIYIEPEFHYLLKPVYKEGIDEVRRANLFFKVGLRHLIILPTEEVEIEK